MAKLLYIQASPMGSLSFSIRAAQAFLAVYRQANPNDTIEMLDLWSGDLAWPPALPGRSIGLGESDGVHRSVQIRRQGGVVHGNVELLDSLPPQTVRGHCRSAGLHLRCRSGKGLYWACHGQTAATHPCQRRRIPSGDRDGRLRFSEALCRDDLPFHGVHRYPVVEGRRDAFPRRRPQSGGGRQSRRGGGKKVLMSLRAMLVKVRGLRSRPGQSARSYP